MSYTNAQVALQVAAQLIISQNAKNAEYARARAASKQPVYPEQGVSFADAAADYLRWLNEQDAKSRTFESLEERVSRLEAAK